MLISLDRCSRFDVQREGPHFMAQLIRMSRYLQSCHVLADAWFHAAA